MFQRVPNFVLAIASALLFSAGWFAPFTVFIFLAWVPLFVITDRITESETIARKKLKIIGFTYLIFLIWNLCTTWWVAYASLGGASMAFSCNPIFMVVTFMIWYNLKQRINRPWAIWLLIPIWLAYEYGHTLWDLTWSWLIMGNAFAFAHNWVQWYEYTGTSGGSLWILAVNILFYNLLKNNAYGAKQLLKPIAAILVPILLSYLILSFQKQDTGNKTYKTLVVQPNVDPYNEKFYFEPELQLQNLLVQLRGKLDSTIDFLVLPETYLTENIFEGRETDAYSIRFLRDSILIRYPKLTIITGANTIYAFKPGEKTSSTARKFSDADSYYDSYNTGMQLNHDGIVLYHKSKLVPGAEKMPFPALFKPLESLALDLGGTVGSLGVQDERTVFFSHNRSVGIAPVICYESIYADYVSDYIQNGANFIFIITNDGWWENTPGHRQHLAYARLRAIENRREIARCANTGISCFITPTGDIEQATPYWEEAVIVKEMVPHNELTFFSRFGDLASYSSCALAILLLIWSQILRYKIFKNRKFEAEKLKH